MDSGQIESVFRLNDQTKSLYGGILAINEVPNEFQGGKIYIINTGRRSSEEINHWYFIYMEKSRKVGYFIDTFGNKPRDKQIIMALINSCDVIMYNNKEIQSKLSDKCGHYCCYMLIMISRGFDIETIVKRHFSHEPKDYLINDAFVSLVISNLTSIPLTPLINIPQIIIG